MDSILQEAQSIIDGAQDKERQYGKFSDSMSSAAKIASEMTGKNITTRDMFICMVALKFGRLKFNDKRDTYVDAAAYLQGMHNFVIEDLDIKIKEK